MKILKKIIKVALIISFTSLILSALFLIVYGEINELNINNFTSIFIWYSLLYTMWAISICTPILIIISLSRKINKEPAWSYVKAEATILLIVTGSTTLLILFYYKRY
jgi:hypothetical protein